jgi:hypothetical protein
MEKRKFLTLLGLELRPPGRPALNQSLYRLRYPGSRLNAIKKIKIPLGLAGNRAPAIHNLARHYND